ncbi:Protein-S-isoprenylcysteine O-methyltransferase Ste14 [Halopseudomonas xinjiangensis]|uniref:Protein-S-isoprenylcysteine O-methyltransferase Ste14 n=1 Tax=Halopseudomonas xinjiangensis TaxID=487184 RepID=A0A1H1T0U9_9GAMM|nr:isoprenylcysteine carboxylmethyltransferase family protein [Halopseudomonas xinjiangensis]SDS53768.1 Protein-S-isoprenylcysteine O-methyltransferase Ste14 [Halopseudomonas xinjiangensis]
MHVLENRLPPPLVAALFGLLMWLVSRYVPGPDMAHSVRLALVLVVLAVGVGFSLAGVVSFRQARTTVNPLKPETASALVRTGVYRYSRNPMYVGFAMALLAWALYLFSPVSLLGVLGFVLYMNRFQIRPEERALGNVFGGEFETYKAQVRRWL